MSCKSKAFVQMAWSKMTNHIVITYANGATWAYPAKQQEYALMHRNNVSAGRFLNKVLKKRQGAVELKQRPFYQPALQINLLDMVILSEKFNVITGLV